MATFKLGRRSPKNHRAILFRDIWTGAMPGHPASEDYAAALSDWQVLGNDQYGDCVAVAWANARRSMSALLGGKEYYPTMNQVIQIYKTQNPFFPAEDNGMDLQTLFEYLTKTPGPDGAKLLAFAKVDISNLEEMKAAAAIFGMPILGIKVLQANMDAFDAGAPWDYISGSPSLGGHAVTMGGYLGKASADFRFVTWGKETSMTDRFIDKGLLEEFWVLIWDENLGTKQFQDGIDLQALADDYEFLTNRPFPLPVPPPPPPTPQPQPVPTPQPAPPPAPAPPPVPHVPQWFIEFLKWLVKMLTGA